MDVSINRLRLYLHTTELTSSPIHLSAVGVRPTDLVSQFPAGVTVAATWDHDLIYERANKMAKEFKGKGVHVLLGPVT